MLPISYFPPYGILQCLYFIRRVTDINRFKKENDGADGRILIINIGSDLAREQNALMNVFFSAHKQGIVVDVANIG